MPFKKKYVEKVCFNSYFFIRIWIAISIISDSIVSNVSRKPYISIIFDEFNNLHDSLTNVSICYFNVKKKKINKNNIFLLEEETLYSFTHKTLITSSVNLLILNLRGGLNANFTTWQLVYMYFVFTPIQWIQNYDTITVQGYTSDT